LDKENKKLKDDNKTLTKQNQTNTAMVTRLTKEKEQLSAKVERSQRLDAGNILISLLNAKGKAVKTINKAELLKLTFLISKNENALVGEQVIYVRLQKPDDTVLTNAKSGTFQFENKLIDYSMKREIEYDGSEHPVEMYWEVGQFLSPGAYNVLIFTEGNQIGRKSFKFD
jgi:hypothetical protein